MADTGHLKTQLNELIKQYATYDVYNRTEYVYTARADAVDESPCSVVRYAYVGTTTRVSYMKEYIGVWDAAWESF